MTLEQEREVQVAIVAAEDARRELEAARSALQAFSRELVELDAMEGIDLETGDLLGFADYFFDGVIADWLMQSRIRKAQDQVDEAIRRVKAMRRTLEKMLEEG